MKKTRVSRRIQNRPSPLRSEKPIYAKIERKSMCFARANACRFHHSAAECRSGPLFQQKNGFCRRVAKQNCILTAFLPVKKASQRAKVAFCEGKPLVFFKGFCEEPGPKAGSAATLKNDVFRKGASEVLILAESDAKKRKTGTVNKHIPRENGFFDPRNAF